MRKFFTTLLVLLCTVSAWASQVGVYCLMNSDGTEIFRNDHICARIRLNNQGTALLEVENLTDRVAYVDRARSYVAVNGFSESLYMTFYEQRLQALVPHGTTILYAWEDLPRLLDRDIIYTGKPGGWYESRCKGWFENKRHKFSKGDQRRYRRNNTPLLLTADIQYGFQQFAEPTEHANVSDYVSRIVVGSRSGVSRYGELEDDCPFRRPCFAFRSGKPTGTIIGECAVCAPVVVLAAIISSTWDTDMPDMHMPSGW